MHLSDIQILRRMPTASEGMVVGLLGGSFNPPHDGHRHISLLAIKRLALTRLWWMVTPGNPIKSHYELAPLETRIKQCQELSRHPKIDVTAFEAGLPSNYTARTLERILQAMPGPRFVWIMGADNLWTIHLWRDWEDIFKQIPIVVIDRPENRYKGMASVAARRFYRGYRDESDARGLAFLRPPAWTFLTIPTSSHSSTEIRRSERWQAEYFDALRTQD